MQAEMAERSRALNYGALAEARSSSRAIRLHSTFRSDLYLLLPTAPITGWNEIISCKSE